MICISNYPTPRGVNNGIKSNRAYNVALQRQDTCLIEECRKRMTLDVNRRVQLVCVARISSPVTPCVCCALIIWTKQLF